MMDVKLVSVKGEDGSAVYGLSEESVKEKWNRKWERHLRRSWRAE